MRKAGISFFEKWHIYNKLLKVSLISEVVMDASNTDQNLLPYI
jgi:hypothetical protein